jgi:hypothetical protein
MSTRVSRVTVVYGAMSASVTYPVASPSDAGSAPRSTLSVYASASSHTPRPATSRAVDRRENASEAPIRNMNTGAAVGPPRKMTAVPIGVAQAASLP